MLKKLLENKKILIPYIIVILLILAVGIFLLIKNVDSSKDNKADLGTQQEKEPYDGDGLEAEKDTTEAPEDSIDASGNWDEPSKDDDKKTDGDNAGNQNGNNNPSDESADETLDDMVDEDTLADDKTWGEIY